MTAAAFLAWAATRPEAERHELVDGEVVAMSPERAAHGRAKGRIYRRLAEAIDAGHPGCEVFVDGMAVRIDDATIYEPDVVVRCGQKLPDDATWMTDPMIVVEVLSPSTMGRDGGAYFRLPSVHHYLIVNTESRVIIHHARDPAGQMSTRIVPATDPVRLDPPGIILNDPLP